MYYRVAVQRQADQLAWPPSWQWKSTVLSSLDAVFQFLRLYQALPHGCLRVFSCSSREEMNEQLGRENTGLSSTSVTAVHFLQGRLIHFPGVTRGVLVRSGGADQQMASIAVATHTEVNEGSREGNGPGGRGMSAQDRRRLELGPGGDHDVPYSNVLPSSMPQVLAWMRLLARIQRGELQP